MFSLPDINRLNSEAHLNRKRLERAARTGRLNSEQLTCEHKDDHCSGELRHYLWYDIFSDDPKGIISLCEHHDGYFGSPDEGYFERADCKRVFLEAYTWERYNVHVGDDDLRLPCACNRYTTDDANWIELTPDNIAAVDFERVRRAPHVIGGRMPVPNSIEFVGNVEMDASTGGKLRSWRHADENPNDAIDNLRTIMLQAMADGHTRGLLVIDASYQFSVSVGVYRDAQPRNLDGQAQLPDSRLSRDEMTQFLLKLLEGPPGVSGQPPLKPSSRKSRRNA